MADITSDVRVSGKYNRVHSMYDRRTGTHALDFSYVDDRHCFRRIDGVIDRVRIDISDLRMAADLMKELANLITIMDIEHQNPRPTPPAGNAPPKTTSPPVKVTNPLPSKAVVPVSPNNTRGVLTVG